jgi:lipoprotein-anchoring transpeptidase ErfK/SrfK
MKLPFSNGRIRLLPSLLLILFCLIGFAALAVFVSPVGASLFPTPVPTHENLWASVNVPKPVNTAVPTALPTDTPTVIPTDTPTPLPTVTEAPGEMVMEIVENTPVPVYEPKTASDSPALSYGGSKYILVDISEQHMYVYEGDTLIYSFVASTGMNNATRVGKFAVQSKIPNAYGSTWNIWMPSWLGIYWAGGLENGIHALPILPNGATLWAGFLGRPVSYGCVVLGTYEAQLLYDWAEIGTPVEIRW